MTHVLYVSYDGIGEPLGRSQVLAYLSRLARDHRITLVSFEKQPPPASLRAELRDAGIEWRPLAYHRRPPVLSTALDVWRGRRELGRVERPDVVHVRSDVPALIAHRLRAPLLFDIRGFWADERVEGGIWRAGGALYRLARRCEARFYARAAAVVTLTEASVPQIHAWTDAPVEVIPTCVDHAAFAQTAPRPDGPRAVWSGSIGTWYRFDLAPQLAAALDMPLTVLTRQTDEARRATDDVRTVAPQEMPRALHAGDVGLCLVVSTPSKRASAPTRFAEFLAAGMPVAVTPGVGDLETLVTEHAVGVVVRDDLRQAAAELRALLADPGLGARCRRLAAERFDVDWGARRYAELYARIGGRT
ncbi:MAG TPA: glycosyltransferase [Solirubrobacteraceae bacterium]